MSLLKFKCVECGNKISKINGVKDIFSIKNGRVVTCTHCKCKYEVSKIAVKIIDNCFNLVAAAYPFIILLIVYFLDKIADFFGVRLGGWVWLIGIILFISMHSVAIIMLPLKKFEDKEQTDVSIEI